MVGCIFAATTIQAMRYPKVIISLVVVLGVLGFFPVILHGAQESGYEEPDVIILGVDSLRPDFLPAYGFGSQSLTPSINRELSGMVVFEDVLTPLARTFVSYMSLLKGEGPAKHGARFNLYPRSEFSTQDNLAWRFKDRGYHTIMAMDESRFANFDQSFGFDEVVSPSVGALDFVVGGSYDLLATNLLLKLPVLNRFFVHLYGNRAAYRTYQLEDHPEKVVRALRAAPKHKPVFLINHLCFPHWPYGSSSLFDKFSPGDMGALPGFEDAPVPYLRALSEVDKQFSLIIEKLRDSGRLENAVVVVMSDHGEGFSMVRDGFHDLTVNSERRYFFGHGSFVLSDAQYRVVLGMQRYKNGRPEWQPRHVAGNVSLIDVAPTLMEEVGAINALSGFEGVSLRALMAAGSGDAPERFRFVESGIRSAGIEKADINESEVAEEMAYLYRIEPDLRFEIRPEFLLKNLAEKQRGVIRGSLGVATMPLGDNPSIRPSCWTVADYEKRTLSCVEYPAGDEVVAEMQHEVCQYFRNDPGFEDRWCQREEYRGQSRLNQ